VRRAALLWLLLATTWVPAGCGSSGGDGDGGIPGATLLVTPEDSVLEVLNGAIPEQTFTAIITYADGSMQDVSATAVWSIDFPELGAFTGPVFRPSGVRGGQAIVRATWSGTSGTTGITVRLKTVRVLDPAPANAPDLFGAAGEDPSRAPGILYPSDRTMVPPNLGDFEVHWVNGAVTNDLFQVTLGSAAVELSVFLLFPIPADPATLWTAFTPDEWAVARESSRGSSLKLSVRGMLAAAPATAGTSAQFAVRVAEEDLQGGIYYWAASASGIYRHDFGDPTAAPQAFYTPAEAGRCVACHSLSRDGTKMAVTFDGGDGAATVIDVASRTPFFPGDGSVRSNFTVFNPEATRMLMTSAGTMTLRDPTTAAVIGTVPTSGYATHPDWSPQGDLITYVGVGGPSGADWYFSNGRIVIQPYDPASDTFGAAVDLVPADASGANLYYPTFSPDGQWILYNRSAEDAYDDGTAEMYVVRVDGSVAPMLLATPNVGGGLTNSWGRWAPFEQTTGGENPEPLFWLTFSSKRAFGVRLGGGRPQIWMAPFFPARAAADPSLPAFRLPFQDLATSNHIAQWTEVVVPIGAPPP
jgi:hypothetical protein